MRAAQLAEQPCEHLGGHSLPTVGTVHYHVFDVGAQMSIDDGARESDQFPRVPGADPRSKTTTSCSRTVTWCRPILGMATLARLLAGIATSSLREPSTTRQVDDTMPLTVITPARAKVRSPTTWGRIRISPNAGEVRSGP